MRQAIANIVANLRARDRDELAEYGVDEVMATEALAAVDIRPKVFEWQGRPVAFIGFNAVTPRALAASLMATDDWPHVVRDVLRWSVSVRTELLSLGFVRAECRTMEGHEDAIRLLERLGFVLECRLPGYGASGRAFLQYAWRLNDHVLERPEDRGPAASTKI